MRESTDLGTIRPRPARARRPRPGRGRGRAARPLGAEGAAPPLGVPRPDGAPRRARGGASPSAPREPDRADGAVARGVAGGARAGRCARRRARRRSRPTGSAPRWRWRTRCWSSTRTPDALAPMLADGPAVVAHDARRCRTRYLRAGLPVVFDTFLAAYLIEPNRTAYTVEAMLDDAGDRAARCRPTRRRRRLIRSAVRRAARCAPWLAAPPRGAQRDAPAGRRRAAARDRAGGDGGRRRPRRPVPAWPRSRARVADEVAELEQQAYELAGGPFTIGSPKQLGEVLFERLGLPADRKGKTGYSTDQRVLAKIRDLHPIVAVVERWRELTKLHSTYLIALPAAHRRRTGASTRRSRRPRPPRAGSRARTRTCRTSRCARRSGARSGARSWPSRAARLLAADYSQVELRILAHLSRRAGAGRRVPARGGRAPRDRRRGARQARRRS